MKNRANILRTAAAAMLVAALFLTACSRKGVHMSKHRKSRKCNCPTFAENNTQTTSSDATTTYFGE